VDANRVAGNRRLTAVPGPSAARPVRSSLQRSGVSVKWLSALP
jgi:hypothetical protein